MANSCLFPNFRDALESIEAVDCTRDVANIRTLDVLRSGCSCNRRLADAFDRVLDCPRSSLGISQEMRLHILHILNPCIQEDHPSDSRSVPAAGT